ncbi:transglutaminase domain-containing protein [Clostridium sp. E02]|uniref:transglutaminase domain-containing protein n=1 Tax=Clostridium sp. E02 TaxID=2487134 RepID=UPI000F52F34A|nr:transglutaminase domain-containing protein [Clostridium sp. E02]
MEPYYYNHMNKQQQRVYQVIKSGLESLSQTIDVQRMDGTELSDIFHKLRLDCPEIYYASTFRYSYYEDSTLIKMKPVYLFDKNKIREHQRAMIARVEKLARGAKDKNDWEKEQYIHDFICENVTYDKLKKQYSHEILGPLGQGVGVCEGIAKSVKILCDQLLIPCIVVISENNLEKHIKYRHAWNVIQIKGIWYHLDATFDNTLGKKEARYDYFNLDDKGIFKDHEPAIYKVPVCNDGDHFYYKEKKLSFTKHEDVAKRCKQAIKKGKVLTFHWRGGSLTKVVMEELLQIIAETAKENSKYSQVSINWSQAVIRVRFLKEKVNDSVNIEDAYKEENEET